MFKAKIKVEKLRKMLQIMEVFNEEAKIVFTKTDVNSRVIDPAHVKMAELNLSAKAFEEYELKKDKLETGIYVEKLLEIMDETKDDCISLEIKDDFNEKKSFSHQKVENINFMYIKLGNIEYKMTLVDSSQLSSSKIPKLALPGKLILKNEPIFNEIKRTLKLAHSLDNNIKFTMDNDKEVFEISAKGDTDDIILKIPKKEFEVFEFRIETGSSKAVSNYSLDMVEPEMKVVNLPFKLMFGSDYPLRLEFSFAEDGKATILQAPRIESG